MASALSVVVVVRETAGVGAVCAQQVGDHTGHGHNLRAGRGSRGTCRTLVRGSLNGPLQLAREMRVTRD